MKFNCKFLTGALLLASVTSCHVDEIEVPADELYTREFIKNFGVIDPQQDWSLIKQGSITLTTPTRTGVKIYAVVNGKTILAGDYADVEGTKTLTFDVPDPVEKVLVKTDGFFEEVSLGASINVAAAQPSRGISGDDRLSATPQIKNGFFREFKFVEAFNKVLPEYGEGGRALKNYNISTDFSFVSNGQPFVFYPIYWNTGAKNTLGVYWYENGELKTQDLFDNYDLDAEGKQLTNNMYCRPTQLIADLAITRHTPADKDVEVHLNGQITVEFNTDIKATQWGRATLRLSSNPSGSQAFLKTIETKGNKAIFTYAGLSPNTEYVFTIPTRCFVPATENDNSSNYSKKLSFTFTTIDTSLKLIKVSPADDKGSTMRTNGKTGTVIMTYNQNIANSLGELPTMISADSTHSATVKLESIVDSVLTFKYSDAQYDTPYNFHVAQGTVCAEDDAEIKCNERIFRFVTMTDPNKYVYNETYNNIIVSNHTYSQGENIAAESDLVSIEVSRDVTPKSHKWEFPTDSTSVTCVAGIGLKSKSTASEENPLAGGAMESSERALMIIKPTVNMRFTAHCRVKNTSFPVMYDQRSFRNMTVEGTGDGKDGSNQLRSFAFELKAGRTYTLYSVSDIRVGAFSYQTVKSVTETDEPVYDPTETIIPTAARSRSRAGENDAPIYDIPTFNSEQDIIDAGFSKITYVEGRVSSFIDFKANRGGKDDVVTHQISITIPAGRVFGFYIRNNSGAQNLTYPSESEAKPYANYSMSSLNKDMPNSFFNSLMSTGDATNYTKGWTKFDKINHTVDAKRKYSVAATYSVDIDGKEYRYFSFEDWVDCDFNDIVFLVDPQSDDVPVVDLEVDTNPYLFAVEDLGAISTSDIDFNDIVFGVEHVTGHPHAFVTMLAAGGTLEAQVLYDGKVIGKEIGEVVAGPGMGSTLDHVNNWFGERDHNYTINVGTGGKNPGFGNLTTVKIEVDPNMSLSVGHESGVNGVVNNLSGFSVRVVRTDGTHTTITKPDANGQVPQMIVVPATWHWPKEGVAIHDAYPGGLTADGDRFASFQNWVTDKYAGGNWYTGNVSTHVISHPWEGSDAAREYVREQTNQ